MVNKLRGATEEEVKIILQEAREWNDQSRVRRRFASVNCTYTVAEYIANLRGLTLWPEDLIHE
jgi:hypothetical protein